MVPLVASARAAVVPPSWAEEFASVFASRRRCRAVTLEVSLPENSVGLLKIDRDDSDVFKKFVSEVDCPDGATGGDSGNVSVSYRVRRCCQI